MQGQIKRRGRNFNNIESKPGILTHVRPQEQQPRTQVTSLPDINNVMQGRLIQIDDANVGKLSPIPNRQQETLSVEMRSPRYLEGVSADPDAIVNLRDCSINMPQGSAVFESKPKIINRNPFQEKFAAAELMMSQRQRMKKVFQLHQSSPHSVNSKNQLRLDTSMLTKDFVDDPQNSYAVPHSQKNLKNLNFHRRSNYLTVDAST